MITTAVSSQSLATCELQLLLEQGGIGPRASLPQSMKGKMLTAEVAQDERRQVVIAYEATQEGRRMLGWATNYCLATDDELHLVHYQVSLDHPYSTLLQPVGYVEFKQAQLT